MGSPPNHRFEAAIFDWDGTAVPDRSAPADEIRRVVEKLCGLGFEIGIVSGTNVDNVDGQLGARPHGPGRLHLCLNRGSEVFEVDRGGPRVVYRRVAEPGEEDGLTRAAELAVEQLARRGLRTEIVSRRLNRRKIDLIPEPEWADPPKARIDELLVAVQARLAACGIGGLAEVVMLAEAAAQEAGLPDARVTSDAKHVEIGLTDKADSAHWLFAHLWSRGIPPRAVLVGGDEFGPLGGAVGSDSLMLVPEAEDATVVSVGVEPLGVATGVIGLGGGPASFLRLLEDQLARREQGELPSLSHGPMWTLFIAGVDPLLERTHESLLAIADGRIGTTGTLLGSHPASAPSVLAAGVYDGEGPETTLLRHPVWTRLDLELSDGDAVERLLDLRTGLLHQRLELIDAGPVQAVLFSSLGRPGTAVLRATGHPEALSARRPLVLPEGVEGTERRLDSTVLVAEVAAAPDGGAVVAARDAHTSGRDGACLDRIAVYHTHPTERPDPDEAVAALAEAERDGFDRLLTESRAAWAERWEDADISIDGDPDLTLSLRFALFHMIASVASTGEAALGARGLTGPGYRGHVFWDTDVFVLPFLAATHPPAARALLEYRVRRLAAARMAAKARGRSGARFPWESAETGFDVTPTSAHDHSGALVPIRTGELEEHITADVAWAADCYAAWAGDEEFAAGPGRTLLVETARYWASRARRDSEGRAHIYGVIGPDEYHEPVDDNAYTNVMARWNLRRAAELAGGAPDVDEEERQGWRSLAEALVDGYHPATGLYEQFAGFFRLEPIVVSELASRRPIAAEVLFGPERVRAAQVLKQADVLMLHHLIPAEVEPGSLEPNLEFYEPRTAHGSSLSPGVHAALFAREGRLEKALEWLRVAARIDLDDITLTSAAGLHMATMGSLWQALAFGFAGLRPAGSTLSIDPRLPPSWGAYELRVRFRGSRVRVRVEEDSVLVRSDPPASVAVAGDTFVATPSGIAVDRRGAQGGDRR
jgi:trehalose/maltose hydrolase-like predicted phosphorylase